jgi:large subunit ribosomal protein L3
MKEFKIEKALNRKGENVTVEMFQEGDLVVTGTSKGKGFQGVVRRHHMAGGPDHTVQLQTRTRICVAKPGRTIAANAWRATCSETVTVQKTSVVYSTKEPSHRYQRPRSRG